MRSMVVRDDRDSILLGPRPLQVGVPSKTFAGMPGPRHAGGTGNRGRNPLADEIDDDRKGDTENPPSHERA